MCKRARQPAGREGKTFEIERMEDLRNVDGLGRYIIFASFYSAVLFYHYLTRARKPSPLPYILSPIRV